MKAKQLSTTSISTACLRSMRSFPLRPRDHFPDPPLAEVQVAEQQPFLDAWGEVEEIQYLAHPGAAHPQLTGRVGIASDTTLLDQPLDVVGQGEHPGGAAGGTCGG